MNVENELQTRRAYVSKIDRLLPELFNNNKFYSRKKTSYLWPCKTTSDYIFNNLLTVYKLLQIYISLNQQGNIIINVQIRQYILGKFKLRDNQNVTSQSYITRCFVF